MDREIISLAYKLLDQTFHSTRVEGCSPPMKFRKLKLVRQLVMKLHFYIMAANSLREMAIKCVWT